MPRTGWPSKAEAERWEVEAFMTHYRRLTGERTLEVVRRQERPDWIVRDLATSEVLGVELTSVYLDDRSVPDLHRRDGVPQIPYREEEIAAYGARIGAAVQKKVRLARSGYDTNVPLILSVYANEYVTIHMKEKEWQDVVDAHGPTFDDMYPITEVVIWPLVNGGVLRIRPSV